MADRNMKTQSLDNISTRSSISYFSLPNDSERCRQKEMSDFLQLIQKYDKSSSDSKNFMCRPCRRRPACGTVNPSSYFYHVWLFVVGCAVVYNLLLIIARSVFWKLQEQYFLAWIICDYVCDLIFVCDIIVMSRTVYVENGLTVTSTAKMAKHYIRGSQFKMDLLAVLPTDLLYLVVGLNCPIVRLNRILKLGRLLELNMRCETWSRYPNICRLISLVSGIIVIIHWNACFYFQMSSWIGFGSDGWVYPDINETLYPVNASLSRMYIYCFYWSTLTLTTIGETNEPEGNQEFIFMIVMYLIGVLLFAAIVGNVGGIVMDMAARRAEFQEKLDAVKRSMTFRRSSNKIQTRVIEWFMYLWSQGQAIDQNAECSVLPRKLQLDLAMDVHLDTLKKISIFSDFEPGFLAELITRLSPAVYSPGDFLCKKGEIGRELYIVIQGKLAVMSKTEDYVEKILEEGDVFGEISILQIPGNKSGNRRICSVRSMGYSHVFILSKQDFSEVTDSYPEARRKMLSKSRQMLLKNKLYESRIIPNNNSVDLSDQEHPGGGQESQSVKDEITALKASLQGLEASIKTQTNQNVAMLASLNRIMDSLGKSREEALGPKDTKEQPTKKLARQQRLPSERSTTD